MALLLVSLQAKVKPAKKTRVLFARPQNPASKRALAHRGAPDLGRSTDLRSAASLLAPWPCGLGFASSAKEYRGFLWAKERRNQTGGWKMYDPNPSMSRLILQSLPQQKGGLGGFFSEQGRWEHLPFARRCCWMLTWGNQCDAKQIQQFGGPHQLMLHCYSPLFSLVDT